MVRCITVRDGSWRTNTFYSLSDQLLKAASKEQPASPTQMPQVSPPVTLPTGNIPPSIHTQPVASTDGRQAEYRPLPNKANKRKHTSKESCPIRYTKDSESDDGAVSDHGGDVSSSGDSFPDAPAPRKRLRVSRITTRSSTSIPATDTDTGGASNPTSPAPAVAGLSLAIPDVDTRTLSPALRIGVLITPISSPDLRSADILEDIVDVSPNGDSTFIETPATHNTGTKVAVPPGAEDTVTTDTEDAVAADIEDVVAVNSGTTSTPTTEPIKASSTADPTLHSPPSQVLLSTINEASVPTFLLPHGKGKRAVNIFHYLQDVRDPRFQRVLFYYLRFEINCGSGASGSLPTTNRPVEIGYWSSRARPANLPDYARGKRTFADFANSILTWWTFIQPPWRVLKRGKVSREVLGGWDDLRAPRINGLLNVVILVYWWINILDELKPGGSVHADYELFAEDVAWVFSKLSS